MWNLNRNDTTELTKQKETHRLRERAYGCQGKGIVRDFGKAMYKLVFKMDNEQELLYSTRNTAQCCVCQPGREEVSGENGYMYTYG